MDNVTHSLAGLLIAEAAVRLRRPRGARREPSASFRLAAAATGVVGANLPDADLLYTAFADDRFAYLLHHRGHTHTVAVAVAAAVALWWAALALWRRRAAATRRRGHGAATAPPGVGDGAGLLAVAVAALLSHLALDFTNSYGVHPFWPLDNRWFYGDAVFIIEPWLWVAAVPALVLAARRAAARVLLVLVLAGGLAAAWLTPFVAPGAALALTAGAAVSFAVAARLRPGTRAAVAVGAWLLVTLVFATSMRVARRTLERAAAAGAGVADVVLTPAVSNPLCANAIVVDTAGGRYRVATARVGTAPRLLAASACAAGRASSPLLGTASRPSTAAVQWDGEWTAPLAELAALARESCEVAAVLRFMRVPVWRRSGDAEVDIADLRYAGGAGRGFAELRVARRPATCPRRVPPWRPPREALLGDAPAGAAPAAALAR